MKLKIFEEKQKLEKRMFELSLKERELEEKIGTFNNILDVENKSLKSSSDNISQYSNDSVKSNVPVKGHELDNSINFGNSLIKKLLLPKNEIPKFEGDFSKFNLFMKNFRNIIEINLENDDEKLIYLINSLKGEPKNLISSCMNMRVGGYNRALNLLDRKYNNKEIIISKQIDKLLNFPDIKDNNIKVLDSFLNELELSRSLVFEDENSELDHPKTIQSLLRKLPNSIQSAFMTFNYKLKYEKRKNPKFDDFLCFVRVQVEMISDPYFGKPSSVKPSSNFSKVLATNIKSLKENCFYCEVNNKPSSHELAECKNIVKMNMDERRDFVQYNSICFACCFKIPQHLAKDCQNKKSCSVCNRQHCTIFHFTRKAYKNFLASNLNSNCDNKSNSNS